MCHDQKYITNMLSLFMFLLISENAETKNSLLLLNIRMTNEWKLKIMKNSSYILVSDRAYQNCHLYKMRKIEHTSY